jgi:hypothetical protein
VSEEGLHQRQQEVPQIRDSLNVVLKCPTITVDIQGPRIRGVMAVTTLNTALNAKIIHSMVPAITTTTRGGVEAEVHLVTTHTAGRLEGQAVDGTTAPTLTTTEVTSTTQNLHSSTNNPHSNPSRHFISITQILEAMNHGLIGERKDIQILTISITLVAIHLALIVPGIILQKHQID